MGCFPSTLRPEQQYGPGDQGYLASLKQQVHALQQQLSAYQQPAGNYPPPGVVHQQHPVQPNGGGGGFIEVLFFPDPGLPCHYMNNCRRQNCAFAHQPTNLTRLQHHLQSAQVSIDVCVFTITCDEISNVLLAAHQRGVRVRVITDNDQSATQGSDITKLRSGGIPVEMDSDQYHMHHKFAVIDGRLVLNGSFNWTRSAVLYNQENVVVSDNLMLVQQFSGHFERLWSKYSNTRR